MITDQVVEKLKTICSDCSRANLDNPQIVCNRSVPPLATYRTRLGGTHKHDSDNLADLLEKWAVNGLNVSLGEKPSQSSLSQSTGEPVWPALGIAVGLFSMAVVTSLVVWRCRRAAKIRKRKAKTEK